MNKWLRRSAYAVGGLAGAAVLSLGGFTAARFAPTERFEQLFDGVHWTVSSLVATALFLPAPPAAALDNEDLLALVAMPLAVAALRLGLSWQRAWRLVLTGEIEGRKHGGRWLVKALSVEQYRRSEVPHDPRLH